MTLACFFYNITAYLVFYKTIAKLVSNMVTKAQFTELLNNIFQEEGLFEGKIIGDYKKDAQGEVRFGRQLDGFFSNLEDFDLLADFDARKNNNDLELLDAVKKLAESQFNPSEGKYDIELNDLDNIEKAYQGAKDDGKDFVEELKKLRGQKALGESDGFSTAASIGSSSDSQGYVTPESTRPNSPTQIVEKDAIELLKERGWDLSDEEESPSKHHETLIEWAMQELSGETDAVGNRIRVSNFTEEELKKALPEFLVNAYLGDANALKETITNDQKESIKALGEITKKNPASKTVETEPKAQPVVVSKAEKDLKQPQKAKETLKDKKPQHANSEKEHKPEAKISATAARWERVKANAPLRETLAETKELLNSQPKKLFSRSNVTAKDFLTGYKLNENGRKTEDLTGEMLSKKQFKKEKDAKKFAEKLSKIDGLHAAPIQIELKNGKSVYAVRVSAAELKKSASLTTDFKKLENDRKTMRDYGAESSEYSSREESVASSAYSSIEESVASSAYSSLEKSVASSAYSSIDMASLGRGHLSRSNSQEDLLENNKNTATEAYADLTAAFTKIYGNSKTAPEHAKFTVSLLQKNDVRADDVNDIAKELLKSAKKQPQARKDALTNALQAVKDAGIEDVMNVAKQQSQGKGRGR